MYKRAILFIYLFDDFLWKSDSMTEEKAPNKWRLGPNDILMRYQNAFTANGTSEANEVEIYQNERVKQRKC